jgi:hypothetical protein
MMPLIISCGLAAMLLHPEPVVAALKRAAGRASSDAGAAS